MLITTKLPSPKTSVTTPKKAVETQESPAPAPTEEFVPSPRFDSKEMRNTMGRFATGVSVITTQDGDEKHGMTVNSLTSVSLDPPMVLFCAKNESKTLDMATDSGTFAVNILAREQEEICWNFAGKGPENRFQDIESTPGEVTGVPLLDGSLANLECKVAQTHQAGDHVIVVGEVVNLESNDGNQEPLLFWQGKLRDSEWAKS